MEKREHYPSDMTDREWRLLEPWIPPAKPGGRPRKYAMREIVNAIRYVLRTAARGVCYRMIFRPTERCFTIFGHGAGMGHGSAFTRDCAAKCAKRRVATGCHRRESSIVNRSRRPKKGAKGL